MNRLVRRISRLSVLVATLCAGLAFATPTSVNVNQADAQTIAEVLNGVGLSRAQAIVEYREQNGEFRDVYELANIKGIGERTVERNEAKIRLKD
ncbi:MAG: ComEA family DNA-binding protein [Gammaproteobacteria bacterium]|nr:ComEA family DNA-binding protein [Gammaproteobacteria bacterium]